ncbi:DUF2514 family protein [Variovorax ureilyticus]|uniref:DUF2514 family protein n=1 Tax=Variovorax ureilyticus TaxID=1836198 RepID=UPI003D679483
MTKIFDIVPGWLYATAIALLLFLMLGQQVRVSNARANVARTQKEFADWKTNAAETRLLADRAQRTEEQRKQEVATKEAEDAAQKLTQARADAAIANAAAGKLRDQLAAYITSVHRAGQDPAPAAGSAGVASADPLDLLADLYSRSDEAAGAIAQYADELRIRGLAAERIADGLQPPDR